MADRDPTAAPADREGAERDLEAAFERWIVVLRDDVIEIDYGYEPGEFTVFPEHWRPMFDEGLTPNQAFERALAAHAEAQREEESARKADWERIKREDVALLSAPTPQPEPPAAGPTLSVEAMAEALRERCISGEGFELTAYEAREIIAQVLTGLPPGPERDAALSAILDRLATPASPAGLKNLSTDPSGTISDGAEQKISADTARAPLAGAVREALEHIVEEFEGTIAQYDKLGPDWTGKDGTEKFDVSVVLDRRELIEAGRAALAAEGEADGWRPIATAPRDGTLVDLRGDEGPYNITSWTIFNAFWGKPLNRHDGMWLIGGPQNWSTSILSLAGYVPTSWRPAPPRDRRA